VTFDEALAEFHKADWEPELARMRRAYTTARHVPVDNLGYGSTHAQVHLAGDTTDYLQRSSYRTALIVYLPQSSLGAHTKSIVCTCNQQGCWHAACVLQEVLRRWPKPRFSAYAFIEATERALKAANAPTPPAWPDVVRQLPAAKLGAVIHLAPQPQSPLKRIVASMRVQFQGHRSLAQSMTDNFTAETIATLSPEDGRDLAILSSTNVPQSGYGHPDVPLNLKLHDAILSRLLETGRVFIADDAIKAITLATAVTPTVGWHIDHQGNQKISLLRENGTPCNPCQAFGMWDYNPHNATLAPLLCEASQAAALAQMPILAKDHVKEVRKSWPTQYKNLPSKPANTTLARVVKDAPTAKIKIKTLDDPGREGAKKLVADVVYDYAGTLITADQFNGENILFLPFKSGVQRIERDLDAEEEIRLKLGAAGLSNGIVAGVPGAEQDVADFLNATERLRSTTLDVEEDLDDALVLDIGSEEQPFAEVEEDGSNQWFTVSLGVEIGGRRHDLMPVIASALSNPRFSLRPMPGEHSDARWTLRLADGSLVRIPLAQLRVWIEPIAEWLEADRTAPEKSEKLRVSRLQAAMLAEELTATRDDVLPDLRSAITKLRHTAALPAPTMPSTFHGTLRSFQNEGVKWLTVLAAGGFGGILADDMGLGKTVQVLAHIAHQKSVGEMHEPILVVVPTSLLTHWENEAARFTPSLKVLRLHGPMRSAQFENIPTSDLILTTYALLLRDKKKLCEHRYSMVVLDEAGAIKNARSHAANAVRELKADRYLLLSGTPLENHLGELWALLDVALPSLVGNEKHFRKSYRTKIEKHGDTERLATLKRRIAPFMLRRRKEEVELDLPAKTESVRFVEMEARQATYYETIRASQHDRVKQLLAEKGLAKSGIEVLDALLKLRQVCCHPALVKLQSAASVGESAKLDALLELVVPIVEEGRQLLIFSQFAEMLAIIAQTLDANKLNWQCLTGSTPAAKRGELIANFQAGKVPIFLISLKAGGVGLNLTAADTIVHYDPWWNPAVENQATDRIHRIGQTKPVFIYKLIVKGTVEEKIMALQRKKAELAEAILDGGASSTGVLTEEIIEELLASSVFTE